MDSTTRRITSRLSISMSITGRSLPYPARRDARKGEGPDTIWKGWKNTLTIPRGRPYRLQRSGRNPGLYRRIQTGLDHYKTMQCFAGLTLDCLYDKRGIGGFPKDHVPAQRAKAASLTRPAFAPDWLFRMGMHTFFAVGSVLKWKYSIEVYRVNYRGIDFCSRIAPATTNRRDIWI